MIVRNCPLFFWSGSEVIENNRCERVFFCQNGSSSYCILLCDRDMRLVNKVTQSSTLYRFSAVLPYFQVLSGHESL